MAGNRRQFIAGTASATVVGISEASAQKRGRQRRLAGLHSPPSFGVVHTIALEAQFKNCFLAGLASKNWSPTPSGSQRKVAYAGAVGLNGQYGGGYGHTGLRNAIKNLVGQADVIVTAGGLVGQAAAWTQLTGVDVACVFLIGREPAGGILGTGNGKFCGVILNTQGQYQDAITALSNSPYSADPARIYLVQNANSEMAGIESQDWKSQINTNVFQFFREQNHDENQFLQQVAKLQASSPSPSALVISSDPFFRSKAQRFSPVVAALNVPICYPFQQLYDADTRDSSYKLLLPNGAKLSGADTSNSNYAYYQLGAKTGEVLDAQTASSQPIPPQPIASVRWDGNQWVAQ
jgi:hypothetical protein